MILFKFSSDQQGSLEISSNYENVLSLDVSDRSLNKLVIHYEAGKRELFIRVGVGNPVPLFWAWTEDGFVLSDYLPSILSAMKTADESSIDEVGLLESILFDCPLVDRTLYKNIKKTQMGEELLFALSDKKVFKKWIWLPSIQSASGNEYELHREAKEQVSQLMGSFEPPESGLVLPITGGLDSRLLASLIRMKSSVPIHSYTFQRGWSAETWCAKKVANALSLHHQVINLTEKCYKTFSIETALRSGGLVTAMHTHGIYCCEKELAAPARDLPRVFGYFGDPVTGAMTESLSADQVSTEGPNDIFNKYNRTIFPQAVEKYKEDILQDLEQTYTCFKNSGSKAGTFHEFWKIQQRQNGLITHLFNYHRSVHGVKVIQPFIERKFIDFFLSLPFDHRKDRNLFKRVCREIFPKEFSLPSMHFRSGSWMHQVEQTFEKIESVVNRVSLKQELFLNPFKYEQHEKNLLNYLNEDVEYGRQVCERILGVESNGFGFPLWKFGTTAKEGYRLAMLKVIINEHGSFGRRA